MNRIYDMPIDASFRALDDALADIQRELATATPEQRAGLYYRLKTRALLMAKVEREALNGQWTTEETA